MSGAPIPVSAVVGRTLALFGRNFGSAAALAALVSLPVWAADEAVTAAGLADTWVEDVTVIGLWAALSALQLAATISLALARLRGERASLGAALRTGARRLLPVAASCGLAGAAILAGLAVLIVPGLVAFASLAVAPPVAVDERGGPWRALVRSLDLTRGQRGRTFAALVLVVAIASVAVLAVFAVLVALQDAAGDTATAFAGLFGLTMLLPLPGVGSAVVYEGLREVKESPRRGELDRVFG